MFIVLIPQSAQAHIIILDEPIDKQFSGCFLLQGCTLYEKLFIYIHGPTGEVEWYRIEVNNGNFAKKIPLNFGVGEYNIGLGNSGEDIQFKVNNMAIGNQFILPSYLIDSEAVWDIAQNITAETNDPLEKARLIHEYVVKNFEYYLPERYPPLVTASEIIKTKQGICRDFSFVYAALARAVGLPAKVVYGDVVGGIHAWNEVMVGDKWITVDCTRDLSKGKDKISVKHFNPDEYLIKTTYLTRREANF